MIAIPLNSENLAKRIKLCDKSFVSNTSVAMLGIFTDEAWQQYQEMVDAAKVGGVTYQITKEAVGTPFIHYCGYDIAVVDMRLIKKQIHVEYGWDLFPSTLLYLVMNMNYGLSKELGITNDEIRKVYQQ